MKIEVGSTIILWNKKQLLNTMVVILCDELVENKNSNYYLPTKWSKYSTNTHITRPRDRSLDF